MTTDAAGQPKTTVNSGPDVAADGQHQDVCFKASGSPQVQYKIGVDADRKELRICWSDAIHSDTQVVTPDGEVITEKEQCLRWIDAAVRSAITA